MNIVIVLLIILYTLCFIVIFDRITAKSRIRLTRKEIGFGFAFKVLMGITYGWIFQKFFRGDDTWMFFYDSLNEYNKLLFQTGSFFREYLALDSLHKYPDFASNFRDFLENMEYNAIAKSLAFFNILGFQNYYTDVVFFNIFSFCGTYLLFKLFANHSKQRLLVYVAAFFIPPITFWLSGIRGEGLLLLAVGVSMYYFFAYSRSGRTKHLLLFALGLLGIFIFRFQFFLIMVPFFIAWGLCLRFKWKPLITFSTVFLVCMVIFFASSFISPAHNLPDFVVSKQHEFLSLKGNTTFKLNQLEPNVSSFASTFPQALVNSFFRPCPWEAKGMLQWASAIEIVFFWLVLLFVIVRGKKTDNLPLLYFVFFCSFCLYLLIGYTVPFPGAIVRYKIVPEFLMFLVLIPALPITLKKMYI